MVSSDGLDFMPAAASSRSGDLAAAFSIDQVVCDRAAVSQHGYRLYKPEDM
jgi:hypothetical protein